MPDAALPASFCAFRERPDRIKKEPSARILGLAAEALRRKTGLVPFPVQYAAAWALSRGEVIQMNTGEGKTLTAVLAAAYRALDGKGVHVVTVNEYLARRDYENNRSVFEALGLTVGLSLSGMETDEKKAAYAADVTYTTATEAGFDYLRDAIAVRKDRRVHRELYYAIIDEADSILLDEAVTPMILSGQGSGGVREVQVADMIVRYLTPTVFASLDECDDDFEIDTCPGDYVVDEKRKTASLTAQGIAKIEKYYRIDNLFDEKNLMIYHRVLQAVAAWGTLKKDVDYIVKNGKIALVDRTTGRVMDGRRYCAGLQQALEAREKLEIHPESATVASITYQKFFSLYGGVCGMTGTAWRARWEFGHTYHAAVRRIPQNRPCIRVERKDRFFDTQQEKLSTLCDEAREAYDRGRPVLIGTPNDACSERVSQLLTERGVSHIVLNAKQDADEAKAIAGAGMPRSVVVSTNIAGRGTDILLGGGQKDAAEAVRKLGGLLVLGAERQRSRRMDEQLAGRAGRQGDPGESRFFVSGEDDLIRYFDPDCRKLTSSRIKALQRLSEGTEASQRKLALECDEVLQCHRQNFLRDRNILMETDKPAEVIRAMLRAAMALLNSKYPGEENRHASFRVAFCHVFGKKLLPAYNEAFALEDYIAACGQALAEKEREAPEAFDELGRAVLLQCMDESWSDFLESFEYVKQGYQWLGMNRKDKINALVESTAPMFDEMKEHILTEGMHRLFCCHFSLSRN